jgi:hypothetical protein
MYGNDALATEILNKYKNETFYSVTGYNCNTKMKNSKCSKAITFDELEDPIYILKTAIEYQTYNFASIILDKYWNFIIYELKSYSVISFIVEQLCEFNKSEILMLFFNAYNNIFNKPFQFRSNLSEKYIIHAQNNKMDDVITYIKNHNKMNKIITHIENHMASPVKDDVASNDNVVGNCDIDDDVSNGNGDSDDDVDVSDDNVNDSNSDDNVDTSDSDDNVDDSNSDDDDIDDSNSDDDAITHNNKNSRIKRLHSWK